MDPTRYFAGLVFILLLIIDDIRNPVDESYVLKNKFHVKDLTMRHMGRDGVPTTNQNAGPHAVPVLIFTYMRSGSSLAGDIMQQATEAFYVYEPIRLVGRPLQGNGSIWMVNGTRRLPPFDDQAETVNVLRNWFSCNLQQLWVNNLHDGFLSKGIKTKEFQSCFKAETKLTKNKTTSLNMCVVRLQKACLESPVRVIKTIRMPMNTMKTLLTDFPNLKLIHLIRDPRATLSSQNKVGMCSKTKHGGQEGCTNSYCKRVENDILESEALEKHYPGNIMTLFYEDMALQPIETARAMYEFVGTSFTAQAEKYVHNITMAGNANGCVICTSRSNSSEHVDDWKKKTARSFIDIIQERCNYILNKFKYKFV